MTTAKYVEIAAALSLCAGFAFRTHEPMNGRSLENRYSVLDLGVLGGGNSEANGVNDSGQVVGWSSTTGGGMHGFLWREGKMTDLGSLGRYSMAKGINNLGQVIGWTDVEGSQKHGFLWEPGRGMKDIGSLGGDWNEANGINARGQIVGYLDGRIPFVWANGRATVPSADVASRTATAYAINNRGKIVGYSMYRPCIWLSGLKSSRPTLIGTGDGAAIGVNDKGQVVGVHKTGFGFLWEHGRLTDFGATTNCMAINDAGTIVGHGGAYTSMGPDGFAAIWDHGRMIDLNTLIPKDSGWVLYEARGINNVGQIVGMGRHNGYQRGFLLTASRESVRTAQ